MKAKKTPKSPVAMAHLYQTLKIYKGNVKATCEVLGMDRNYFYVLVKRNSTLKTILQDSRSHYRKLTGRLRHRRLQTKPKGKKS